MTERDALHAAVLADPDGDLPRLVFADWCDDHGEADRAELIRVQCALARMPCDDPPPPALEARERALLTPENRLLWRVPGFHGVQQFRRGFVEGVRAAAEQFVAFGDRLFDLAPVRAVRLSVLRDHVPAVCRVAGLARIDTLDVSGNWLGFDDRLERLLTDAPLGGLRTLIARDNRLFAEAVPRITQTAVAPRLTTLNLSGNPLSDDGAEALAAATRLRGLRSLVFRNDEQSYEDSVHAAGAAALAGTQNYPLLERLDLSGHRVGDAGLIALVRSGVGGRLRELRLARNDIGETGGDWAERLTDPARRLALRLLDLSGGRNHIDPLAAVALAGWSRLAGGLTLDLRGCGMSAAAHARLRSSPYARHLLIDDEPPPAEDSL